MAARDIFTGGACNVGPQTSGQVNQNPFMKFMDTLFQGNAQNKQMVQGFKQDQGGDMVEQQLQLKQEQMKMLEQQWNTLSQEHKDQQVVEQKMQQLMQSQFQNEQMAYQQMMQVQHQHMQQMWQQEQINHQAANWAQEQQMKTAFEEAQKEELSKQEEQNRIQNATNELFDKMAQDSDPRFKNSKFLKFLDQIKTGEVKIEGKELIVNPEKMKASMNETMEKVWEESKTQVNNDITEQLNSAWQQGVKDQEREEAKLEDDWAKRIEEYEKEKIDDMEFQQRLEAQYKEALQAISKNEEGNEDIMENAWDMGQQLEEQEIYREASDVYNFNPNNPFLNHPNPFALGLELMEQGKFTEAILAFEAQIQKDPKNKSNSNTWRIMGRVLQDNDQDQKAVACFLNSLKFNDNNLDTLLALGISCTNILDEVKAMNFLKQWIQNNDQYKQIPIDPALIPPEGAEVGTEQVKHINQQMIHIFETARSINPQDSGLLQSLAVLNFIQRDYEKSVILFQQALEFDPENYSLWNKLGATLAHLGRADEAMTSYQKALDIRPNYVRAWVNIGIAHAYKSEYDEAARFYLNALSFNPDAAHIWTYLQTAFMCLQRFDLVGKIVQKNVEVFADEFEILKVEELPPPDVSYGESSANVIIKQGQEIQNKANNWAQELANQQ